MVPLYKPTQLIGSYFDGNDKFTYLSNEEKLAELSNCIYHGYDLYSVLKKRWENSESKERSDIYKSLCDYIGMLRGSGPNPLYYFRKDKELNLKHLKQMVDLFEAEIFGIYRLSRENNPYYAKVKDYYDILLKKHYADANEFEQLWYSPTPLVKIPISEDEVIAMNPWKSELDYVKPIYGGSTLYDDNAQCVLKCDETYISEHNRNKKSEYVFWIQKWPKPFIGNPLKAKVILLSLNPGYKDWQKRKMAKALTIYYREAIFKHLREQTSLEAISMFCPNNNHGSLDISNFEAHTLVDNYWYDIIEAFRKDKIPQSKEIFDPLYSKLSVIQYLGYASESFKDLSRGKILPSQYYTRLLIQHLTVNSNTIFVVLSSEKKWRKLLGDDIWNLLVDDKRLIHGGKRTGVQRLSKTNLGNEEFNRLIEILK